MRAVFSVIGYTNQFVSLVFTVLTSAAVFICAKGFFERGMAGKWVLAIPIIKIVQSVAFFIWKMVFQSWAATIGDYAVIFFFMGVYTVWMIRGAMKLKKTASANAEKEAQN
jgi:hypothetical protein